MVKQIVPLTFGPGGERIGEAEVDFDNPTAPMLMRFDNARDAEIMGELIQGKIIESMSLAPNRDSIGVMPILPPEMRDTLGVEIPELSVRYSPEVEGKLRNAE